MNQEEYKTRFRSFVLDECRPFYESVKPWYVQESGQPDSLLYFDQQFPRIWAIIEMLKDRVAPGSRLCELGSFYPYVMLYFGGTVNLYDLVPRIIPGVNPYESGGVRLVPFNLCSDEFPRGTEYDAVTLSEVMEHLPCDLIEVQRKTQSILSPKGLLLVSYPCQYQNDAHDYDKVIGDPSDVHGRHLREFTPRTVDLFFRGLTVLEKREVFYPAYGRTILVLYKNEQL